MKTYNIPFNKPFVVGKELYYIARAVIENRHTAGDGPFTKKCNTWLEENLSCQKAFLTHSCTAALEMSAILCDIKPGDEVIMPSFTFVSTANAFVLRGGIPVFVDIREDTQNIDEHILSNAITKKTKAIVPVHYAGTPCNMDSILNLAKDKNLRVIEDAAQGYLSTYKGKYLGTLGDIGCLSFHETKNIISGEGGALLLNDPELVERAEIIWEKGTNRKRFFRGEVDKYTWVDIGSSFLPSDIIAAFLYAQLESAEKIIAARCRIFETYLQGLLELEKKGIIRLPMIANYSTSNGHIMYILSNSLNERTRLINYLKDNGVNAVFHYIPLHLSPMGKKHCRIHGNLPNTERISECLVRLPMYYEMSDNEVNQVVELVKAFYQ
ncbi:MAG: dTDP-4-amino-4,6-dideoxygalactose transaminase [Bacteroidales bacterium]|nr:dTDP-4-amino-4,6-dideoxygalactose transaminase [Bacteroidales bacterium]